MFPSRIKYIDFQSSDNNIFTSASTYGHQSCRTGIFKTPCSRMDDKLFEAIPVQALRIPGG
jgi:hypothetical protein